MDSPQTTQELNAAIIGSFHILESSRAFESFPFSFQGEGGEFTVIKRVPMLAVALKGPEDLCCAEIWQTLRDCVSNTDDREDNSALLFVRLWFAYKADEDYIRGRVAFYDSRYQQALLVNRIYQADGYVANKVIRDRI